MDLPDVIDRVRPGVVQITLTITAKTGANRARLGGKKFLSTPLGTGFIINEDPLVVTAKHVIDGARKSADDFPDADVHVGVGLAYPNSENMRGNFSVTGFDILEEDELHDLALLKMRSNPFTGEMKSGIVMGDKPVEFLYGVSTLRNERPRDGDTVAISGYPLSEPVLVTNSGIVASSWSVIVEESAHPTFPDVTIPEIRDVYLADVQSNPGNSGGPVYSVVDGSVIGVLVAGRLTDVLIGEQTASEALGVPLTADAGLSIVIPAKCVVDLLNRNDASFTTS